jgi:hypothetical protein
MEQMTDKHHRTPAANKFNSDIANQVRVTWLLAGLVVVLLFGCGYLALENRKLSADISELNAAVKSQRSITEQKAQQIGVLTAEVVALKVADITSKKTVAFLKLANFKSKVAGRIQRTASVVPIMGMALWGYFEKKDFEAWLEENPQYLTDRKTGFVVYLKEIAQVSREILESAYPELGPKKRAFIQHLLSKISDPTSATVMSRELIKSLEAQVD